MKHTYVVKYDDENIREFLESGVPLDLYCVFQFENDEGLIHSYQVGDGRLWVVGIEDDELNESCIKYLKKQNAPVFSDIKEMRRYGDSLREKFDPFLEQTYIKDEVGANK